MNITIDWIAFLEVFLFALIAAATLVFFYGSGLRMMVRSGRVPVVAPAEFPDAITVMTPKEIRKAEKLAAKAARKSPLSEAQKTFAFAVAIACFAVCVAVIVTGIVMIVIY